MDTGFSTSGAGRWVFNTKTGERRLLGEGQFLQDGEELRTVFSLMDHAAKAAAPVTSETLSAGRKIIGDTFDRADYAHLTNVSAKRKLVEAKLGASGTGKLDAFVDAAFRILATDEAPRANVLRPKADALVLTDAQRAVAEDGIRRALAANAADKTGGAITDAAADGARQAQSKIRSEAWKSPARREEEAKLIGLTYEERIAARFNAAHPAGGYTAPAKR